MTSDEKLWPLEDLASPGDLAKVFGVSSQLINSWQKRYDDFPEPIGEIASAPLFSRRQVIEWRHRFLASRAARGLEP